LKVPEPIDIHLHLPAGPTKKGGPSAGVAMVSFLFFALSDAHRLCRILIEFNLDLCIRVSPNGGLRATQHRHDGRGKSVHEGHKLWNYGSPFPTLRSH
jgi:ATP-dependent Lon protease